ncbi:hypothetical protein Tco_1328719 [Tanacetum coccineum]
MVSISSTCLIDIKIDYPAQTLLHNMVAFLEKSTGSEGFHQVIDFLNRSHICYALTKKPDVYISFIKQFWRSAEATTDDNGEATIDGHSKTITEASLRRHLKFDDHDDKLTFQKGAFSPQWRFLIHTILHCLSPKKTAWEQFSSNIATAVICQEVDLFPTMLNVSEPSTSPSRITSSPSHSPEPSPSHSHEPSIEHSPDHTTAVVSFPSPTQPTQPSPGAEQHIPTPHDSPLHVVHSHGSDEGSLKLIELTNLVTKLSERIGVLEDDLKKTKQTYRVSVTKQYKVQEKASTETEPIIQEVTPTEVIQDQRSMRKEIQNTAGRTVTYRRRSEEKRTRKDKGKAILTEPEPKKKSKKVIEQERLSFVKAIRLQEQMNEEQRAQIARDEEIARQWDEEEKQRAIKDRNFNQHIEPMEHGSEKMKSPEKIEEEDVDTQKEMKEVSKESGAKRKKSLPRKSTRSTVKRQKMEEDAEKDYLKGFLDIVPREEEKISCIIKSSEEMAVPKKLKILSEMLEDFDRQDVMDLHRLVKERYSASRPEGYDLMLWGDLHTLFEPDEEDEIWKNQHEYNVISWSLYDFCGIHILLMQNGIAIHMLTKKKYPLSQEMITKMLNKRLKVDHESTQAYELLKFIRSQVQKIDQGVGSTSGIRACALRNFDLEVMELENTQNNALAKLPMLKLGEYEMWEIRIKQYFQIQDFTLWEVTETWNSWVPISVTTSETDGAGFDWSDMAEEEIQANMALMAFSDSEVKNDKSCSKNCLKNYEALKKQYDDLLVKLSDTDFKAATYKEVLTTFKLCLEDSKIPIDWVSDDENDDEPNPKVEKKTVIPTATKKEFVKPEKPVKRSISATKHMAPRAVLMKDWPKSVNSAKAVNYVWSVKHGRPFSNASGGSRHMTGNIAHLSDFKDFDRRYVTFGGVSYGGRITGKGTIKTENLDFDDVYFVKELKFNLQATSVARVKAPIGFDGSPTHLDEGGSAGITPPCPGTGYYTVSDSCYVLDFDIESWVLLNEGGDLRPVVRGVVGGRRSGGAEVGSGRAGELGDGRVPEGGRVYGETERIFLRVRIGGTGGWGWGAAAGQSCGTPRLLDGGAAGWLDVLWRVGAKASYGGVCVVLGRACTGERRLACKLKGVGLSSVGDGCWPVGVRMHGWKAVRRVWGSGVHLSGWGGESSLVRTCSWLRGGGVSGLSGCCVGVAGGGRGCLLCGGGAVYIGRVAGVPYEGGSGRLVMDGRTGHRKAQSSLFLEPDKESEIWMNQNEYNLISWSLCDLCGVHILLMQNGIAIHMLTEKKYPLSQEMLSKMAGVRDWRLIMRYNKGYELLKVIRSQVTEGRKLSDVEVQEKASTETEPFIQEVTPTEVIQDQGSSEKGNSEVSTAGATKGTASEVPVVSTAEVNISTAGRTVTYRRRSEEKRTRKDKGKAIMTESEPKKKSKKELEQEKLSFAETIRLQEQMDEEQRAQIARDEEIAKQ